MEAPLSLADHVCLAIIGEGRTHGWALVKLLEPEGELGRIWLLSRPLTYRSIDTLVERGLVRRGDESRRVSLSITPRGRAVRRAWLDRPVLHLRELRTEFLVKLELRARAGMESTVLVVAQRDALKPAFDALTTLSPIDPVGAWRRESALAARRFLDGLVRPPSSRGRRPIVRP